MGGGRVRKCGRSDRNGLLGADVSSDPFVGEKREVDGAVVVCTVGFVRIAIF